MVATSRDRILNKLRSARTPFEDVAPIANPRDVAPVADLPASELYDMFVEEARKLNCIVHEPTSSSDALEIVVDLLGDDDKALMWKPEHIPLNGLDDALQQKGVKPAELRDRTTRVGITGVDGALAATGSLVVMSGDGKSRQASLLPLVHVAVMRKDQILPNLEAFYQNNRDIVRDSSNIAVISGPSKSADIAMELILGMHGPGEVHIVITP